MSLTEKMRNLIKDAASTNSPEKKDKNGPTEKAKKLLLLSEASNRDAPEFNVGIQFDELAETNLGKDTILLPNGDRLELSFSQRIDLAAFAVFYNARGILELLCDHGAPLNYACIVALFYDRPDYVDFLLTRAKGTITFITLLPYYSHSKLRMVSIYDAIVQTRATNSTEELQNKKLYTRMAIDAFKNALGADITYLRTIALDAYKQDKTLLFSHLAYLLIEVNLDNNRLNATDKIFLRKMLHLTKPNFWGSDGNPEFIDKEGLELFNTLIVDHLRAYDPDKEKDPSLKLFPNAEERNNFLKPFTVKLTPNQDKFIDYGAAADSKADSAPSASPTPNAAIVTISSASAASPFERKSSLVANSAIAGNSATLASVANLEPRPISPARD